MCFGVRDAVALALEQPPPLTVLGDLVHNAIVLHQLRVQGVQIEHQVARISTPTVMITAHGAAQRTIARLREQGLNVLEATCPLVRVLHRAVRSLVQAGCHPVIIGRREHAEVRGVTGDLDEFDVVLNEEDVAGLKERPSFGIAAQTTQPINRVRRLVALIRERFPHSEVRFVDTVCQPTKQRQRAAIEVAFQSDAVVVIGGENSNNTRELVATCAGFCPRVYHVQTAAELRFEWFADAETVGLTAGTSTPDEIIDDVERTLEQFAARAEHSVMDPIFNQEGHEAPFAVV